MTDAGVAQPVAARSWKPLGNGNVHAAVIGGGKISEQHLSTLKHFDGVHVAGVCDLSPALAQFTADRFGAQRWFTDYTAMLDETPAQVVHVLTPPATHDRIVRDCLMRGCHVIVEKPIALSNTAFLDLWEVAQTQDVRLIENHNYGFNQPIRHIEQAIANWQIGSIEEVEVRMTLGIRGGGRYADRNLPHPSHKLPAGVLHEFITHMAYLLLKFMPEGSADRMDLVRAAWRNHGGGDLFKYDDLDATITAGAVHGRLRFSCRQWPDCLAVQVRGSDGIANAELFYPASQVITRRPVGQHLTPLVNSFSSAKALMRSGVGSVWNKVRNRSAYEGLSRFLELTYSALREGSEPPVGFKQMDETSRLIDALLAPENQI